MYKGFAIRHGTVAHPTGLRGIPTVLVGVYHGRYMGPYEHRTCLATLRIFQIVRAGTDSARITARARSCMLQWSYGGPGRQNRKRSWLEGKQICLPVTEILRAYAQPFIVRVHSASVRIRTTSLVDRPPRRFGVRRP